MIGNILLAGARMAMHRPLHVVRTIPLRQMNTESVDCRNVPFGQMEKVGDVSFDEDLSHIYIWLPGISGPGEHSGSRLRCLHDLRRFWTGSESVRYLRASRMSVDIEASCCRQVIDRYCGGFMCGPVMRRRRLLVKPKIRRTGLVSRQLRCRCRPAGTRPPFSRLKI